MSSVFKNAKEWTRFWMKSNVHLMIWNSVWLVLWTSQMLWKVFKEVYNSTKYQQVGKVLPIHQERILLYGSMNWSRDAINFNSGHQSSKHLSPSVSLIFSILWVSLLLSCKRLQEIKSYHLITWLYKLMLHSSSQLKKYQVQLKTELTFTDLFLKVLLGNSVLQDKMDIWLSKNLNNYIQNCQLLMLHLLFWKTKRL